MMRRKRQAGLWLAIGLAAGLARGGVYADFSTSQGAFTVELNALAAPRAVANFIGLVDGTQSWRDPVTGAVRGGDAGGAFYEGTSFYSTFGSLALLGGLRLHGGTNELRAGPGYAILDDYTNGTSLIRGTLAMATFAGPHSGGAELALVLSNAMAATDYEWTAFGEVVGSGMDVVDAITREVTNGTGQVAAQIAIRADEMTPAEEAALAAARGELPVVAEMPLGFGRESNRTAFVAFWSTNRSQACLSATSNLLADAWSVLPGSWNAETNPTWRTIPLASIPAVGERHGSLYGSQAVYPNMTAALFSGQHRLGVAHTGVDVQYWLDFSGGTGMWAIVEGGTPVYWDTLQGLGQQLATANSVYVYFLIGTGLDWTLYAYWLGFDEENAATGRFYNEQWHMNAVLVGRDWGTFELAPGWAKTPTAKSISSLRAASPIFPGLNRDVPLAPQRPRVPMAAMP